MSAQQCPGLTRDCLFDSASSLVSSENPKHCIKFDYNQFVLASLPRFMNFSQLMTGICSLSVNTNKYFNFDLTFPCLDSSSWGQLSLAAH